MLTIKMVGGPIDGSTHHIPVAIPLVHCPVMDTNEYKSRLEQHSGEMPQTHDEMVAFCDGLPIHVYERIGDTDRYRWKGVHREED